MANESIDERGEFENDIMKLAPFLRNTISNASGGLVPLEASLGIRFLHSPLYYPHLLHHEVIWISNLYGKRKPVSKILEPHLFVKEYDAWQSKQTKKTPTKKTKSLNAVGCSGK